MLTDETWLKRPKTENATIVSGFKSIRINRETQQRGGCLVYVTESTPYTFCQDAMLNNIQDAIRVRTEMGVESLPVG